ncbi:MAG: hypothetical protein WAN48_04490 [Actinomycetes bacterium]
MNSTRRARLALGVMAAGALAAGLLPLGSMAAATVATGPTNLAPDSTSTWVKNVVLTWDAIDGASSYEVQLSNDGFNTDGAVLDKTVASNRYEPPVSIPRGNYVWRVRATTGSGTTDWSATADLLKGWDPSVSPVLSAVTGSASDFAVDWTPVADASYYEVSFSKESSAGSASPVPLAKNEGVVCYTTHTSWTPSLMVGGSTKAIADGESCSGDIEPGVNYFIRVRGRDGTFENQNSTFVAPAAQCTGAWFDGGASGGTPYAYETSPQCSAWSNEVAKTSVASIPSAAAPADNSLKTYEDNTRSTQCSVASPCADAPLMTWQNTGAAAYRVWLTRDPAMSDWDRVYKVYGSQFRMADTMNDRALPWYWRVQALSDTGWSWVTAGATFAVKNAKPSVVGATPDTFPPAIKTNSVDFTWPTTLGEADHDAKAWTVQVSTKDDFSDIADSTTTDRQGEDPGFSSARFESLPQGVLYWRYRAVDQTGSSSPWSATLTFKHDSAIPVVSITTGNGFALNATITLGSTVDIDNSTVSGSTLGVRLKNGATVNGTLSKVSTTKWTFTPNGSWVAGATYVAWADPTVLSTGGISAIASAGGARPTGLVDSSSKVMKKNPTKAWDTFGASKAVGNSYIAAKSGSPVPTVTVTFGGSQVEFWACKAPSFGKVSLQVDSAAPVVVNLANSTFRCSKVKTLSSPGTGLHTLTIKPTSKKFISVDAVKAL